MRPGTSLRPTSKEEALRIWCLWLDHGLGVDEDMDCFVPELMRQCPMLGEREQCVLIRCIAKVVALGSGQRGNDNDDERDARIDPALVPPSHSSCLTQGPAPFVRESIEAMRPCAWTRRPLERLRRVVTETTNAWPTPKTGPPCPWIRKTTTRNEGVISPRRRRPPTTTTTTGLDGVYSEAPLWHQ